MLRRAAVDTAPSPEAHRTGSRRAPRGGHRPEAVERCITGPRTGAQTRRPEQRGDEAAPRAAPNAVRAMTGREKATAPARGGFAAPLGAGERAPRCRALVRADAGLPRGPDGVSLCPGVRFGPHDRRAGSGASLDAAGHRPNIAPHPADAATRRRGRVTRRTLEEGVHPA